MMRNVDRELDLCVNDGVVVRLQGDDNTATHGSEAVRSGIEANSDFWCGVFCCLYGLLVSTLCLFWWRCLKLRGGGCDRVLIF